MKKIIFITLAILVVIASALFINKEKTMSKGNLMSKEIYTVLAPDGTELKFDKTTNLLVPNNNEYKKVRTSEEYLEIQSKYLLEARSILDSSPYKNYKPLYYNPKPNSLGQTDYLSFKPWLDISYKASSNKLSPWTKSEKAYYESLKDKRDRYIYLVKRSNLKCTMIDIPEDAIGRVDSNGKLTKPEYAEIYYENKDISDVEKKLIEIIGKEDTEKIMKNNFLTKEAFKKLLDNEDMEITIDLTDDDENSFSITMYERLFFVDKMFYAECNFNGEIDEFYMD